MSLNWFSQVRASWAMRKNWVHGKTMENKKTTNFWRSLQVASAEVDAFWESSASLMFHELLAGWGPVHFWVYRCMLKAVNLENLCDFFRLFRGIFPDKKKTSSNALMLFDLDFSTFSQRQSQVWVSCDPVTRVKALNWQDLDHKFPFSMPWLSLPLERVSF